MRKKAPFSRERGLFAGLAAQASCLRPAPCQTYARLTLLGRRNLTHQHATRVVHEFGRGVQLVPHGDHLRH